VLLFDLPTFFAIIWTTYETELDFYENQEHEIPFQLYTPGYDLRFYLVSQIQALYSSAFSYESICLHCFETGWFP